MSCADDAFVKDTAKEVAGKTIGKQGLLYITLDKEEVPMAVTVEDGKVTVAKGNDVTTMKG